MLNINILYTTKIKPYRSALCDWLIILILLIVTATLESPNHSPYHQCVPGYTVKKSNYTTNYPCGSAEDPELHYPYKPNTISSTLLPLLTFGPWILTIIINMLILYCSDPMYRYKAVLKNIEILLRMVLFSCCGTEAVVSIIKFSVGRPRPNFYAMMKRDANDRKQARMSFPSGHSSISFALLFLLSLNLFCAMNYVQIRFRKQKKNTLRISINNPHSYFYLKLWWYLRYYLLLSVLLVFTPTFLAIYIACTRVTDYWHHYADVAVGSLLGIAGSVVSFMIYRDELYPLNIKDYKQSLIPSNEDDNNHNIEREYDIQHKKKSYQDTVKVGIINSDGIQRLEHSLEIDRTINENDGNNTTTTMDTAPTMPGDNKIIDFAEKETKGGNEYNKMPMPMPNQNVSNRNVSSKDLTGNEDEQ